MNEDRLQKSAESFAKHMSDIEKNPKELSQDFLEQLRDCQGAVHLAESKQGKYQIKIDVNPAYKPMTIVSMRNWIMMGYKPKELVLDAKRVIHKLCKGDQLLMSDTPQEMFLQYEAYAAAHGRVLVGGLGIGMYANMIARKLNVTEVVVVEIDADIIELVGDSCNPKIKIIHDDIKHYLKTTKEIYDYCYIDIHYSTGEYEYIHTVLPLRKILDKRFPALQSSFWGEEEMKTQYEKKI